MRPPRALNNLKRRHVRRTRAVWERTTGDSARGGGQSARFSARVNLLTARSNERTRRLTPGRSAGQFEKLYIQFVVMTCRPGRSLIRRGINQRVIRLGRIRIDRPPRRGAFV